MNIVRAVRLHKVREAARTTDAATVVIFRGGSALLDQLEVERQTEKSPQPDTRWMSATSSF